MSLNFFSVTETVNSFPLEICLVTPKEGIVTLGVAGLAVKGIQLWSGGQHTLFCREISFVASYAHMEGGVAKK